MNSSKLFFLGFMIIGVMLCLCSNNWLFIWCGLELSLISFLPLIHNKMIISSESSMKYFLIQSISSAMMIMGLMMMLTMKLNFDLIILISVLIKMGVAPFHLWLLSIVEGLSMTPMILMFTLTKITPLMILTFIKLSLSFIIALTLMTGAILGLNQSSTRKIIAYSSIFNMGLILMSVKNNFVWCYYLIVYSMLLTILVHTLYKLGMFYVNQMIIVEKVISIKMNLWMTLLSMGGMPPLLGFSIKLIVIEFYISNYMSVNLILMILFSLLIMFFYLRMVYLSIMFFSVSNKWSLLITNNLSMILLVFNIMTLPVVLTTKIFY